jgi:hypothetical protein
MHTFSKREQVMMVLDDATFLEPSAYDAAIIGKAERFGMPSVVAYDTDKVMEIQLANGMTIEEAIEFFEFNTLGAWMGDLTPVFITFVNYGDSE